MRQTIFLRVIGYFIFLQVMLSAGFAQGNPEPTFNVSYMANEVNSAELQKAVSDLCRKALVAHSVNISDNPERLLLINAHEIDNRIIVSATTLQALPKQVIDFCVEHQVFYMAFNWTQEPSSEEGQKVRQYVTASFLEGYRCLDANVLFVTSRSELPETCGKIVDGFFKNNLSGIF